VQLMHWTTEEIFHSAFQKLSRLQIECHQHLPSLDYRSVAELDMVVFNTDSIQAFDI